MGGGKKKSAGGESGVYRRFSREYSKRGVNWVEGKPDEKGMKKDPGAGRREDIIRWKDQIRRRTVVIKVRPTKK